MRAKRVVYPPERVRMMLAEFRRCRHASQCSGCMERLTEIENSIAQADPARERELKELRKVYRAALRWAQAKPENRRLADPPLLAAVEAARKKGKP